MLNDLELAVGMRHKNSKKARKIRCHNCGFGFAKRSILLNITCYSYPFLKIEDLVSFFFLDFFCVLQKYGNKTWVIYFKLSHQRKGFKMCI